MWRPIAVLVATVALGAAVVVAMDLGKQACEPSTDFLVMAGPTSFDASVYLVQIDCVGQKPSSVTRLLDEDAVASFLSSSPQCGELVTVFQLDQNGQPTGDVPHAVNDLALVPTGSQGSQGRWTSDCGVATLRPDAIRVDGEVSYRPPTEEVLLNFDTTADDRFVVATLNLSTMDVTLRFRDMSVNLTEQFGFEVANGARVELVDDAVVAVESDGRPSLLLDLDRGLARVAETSGAQLSSRSTPELSAIYYIENNRVWRANAAEEDAAPVLGGSDIGEALVLVEIAPRRHDP